MKLFRFGPLKRESPGVVLADGRKKDLSNHFKDWNAGFFESGGLSKLQRLISKEGDALPDVPETVRMGSPVARPGNVIAIGLNYADHAKEAGMQLPKEPIIFNKAPNTVVGPHDDIIIPKESQKTDWEVELGVIIGNPARYLESPEAAAGHIAGFCVSNDVSERAFQLERGGQWVKGKSCDNFNPLGPYLVTPEAIPDIQNLSMKLWVNGALKQNGNTRTMVFNVYFLIYYLSQFMTLDAGDLISTGTPPGVGMGFNPPQYLKAGDRVELEIEGLGKQQSRCVNYRPVAEPILV